MNNTGHILTQSAQYLKGVGPKRIKSLNKLNIFTIKDLLYYFPRRYEDRGNFKPINKVEIGKFETIRGKVLTMGLRRLKGKMTLFQLAVGDNTGIIYAVWFNQPYMKDVFKIQDEVILYGKVDRYRTLQINSPEYEIIRNDEEDSTIHTGRIVPIYPLTYDVSQRYLRTIAKRNLDSHLPEIEEFMEPDIIQGNSLICLEEALAAIHFPQSFAQLQKAKERLIFNEFFLLQLALGLKRRDIKESAKGIKFNISAGLLGRFKSRLPFTLTASQQKVVAEIEADMASQKPMNRLLQGDVGSGKTIVSIWAMVICVQNGFQAALMAPTEILAEQHHRTIKAMLEPLGVRVGVLTSGLKKKEKEAILAAAENHEIDILIGTHALIQDEMRCKKLGLVIIDEQHKFGVEQRIKLQKKGVMPDVLVMSATPIPRTLAITVYGDLDISTIRELPPGRTPVETYWISEKKRRDLYVFLKKKITEKNQVYVVYPLIEQSKLKDLKAATIMFEHFRDEIFPECRVGLLHGRMKDAEKKAVMEAFKQGQLDILVATTVIEVGIDVANAAIMLIEHAERFGLSQLHQLRGRVGRGKKQAYCVLLSQGTSEDTLKRLRAMTSTTDGFKIAEYDLLIRGPGEFFGTRQHGMPELKIGNIITDRELLVLSRKEAFQYLENSPDFLTDKENKIARELKEKFPVSGEGVMGR
ncbi:MAG: ATP-dependent DNA helicase RecG [Candidatus Omnitrophica bacterium]|nr:ATP-dependent DNA helicase RecG [Candidatus Omnitrophota bacterium]MBU4479427.1 ATP-dependent DNA helicase RecG [Candidatus Omnitrophota bacterium]MCG2703972.1 ATP-dependent DNA helicase RecG [Candidatus Omnitrophota bacterium]